MAKWHGYGRCKTRLSQDIGKSNSVKVQHAMTKHTTAVAKSLENKKIIDISLAVSGLGIKQSKRWSRELGIKKFNLQGGGCLGEKMKRQVLINNKYCTQNKIQNIIFIGTDLPNLCHQDILTTIKELKHNDLILGPSNDGGYWIIGLSKEILLNHMHLPFIRISWGSEKVLQRTIDNFACTDIKYTFLHTKTDIDRITDIEDMK
tara:strand:+ start:163 stop:774 length:612 start_codon:yes stop_codon:yes gene_type:complete